MFGFVEYVYVSNLRSLRSFLPVYFSEVLILVTEGKQIQLLEINLKLGLWTGV